MTDRKIGSLFQKTFELLHTHDKSLLLIYKEADIPFYWLRKFYDGEIKNPSVNRIQELYEYLSGKKLDV